MAKVSPAFCTWLDASEGVRGATDKATASLESRTSFWKLMKVVDGSDDPLIDVNSLHVFLKAISLRCWRSEAQPRTSQPDSGGHEAGIPPLLPVH